MTEGEQVSGPGLMNGAAYHDEPAQPADDLPFGLTPLGPLPSERKVREWALVLQSMSIRFVTRHTLVGWYVLVPDEDVAEARASIARYEEENRDWPPRRARDRARFTGSIVFPIALLALAAFFMLTGPSGSASRWFGRGTSVTALVLSREPWRAVTALTLHADSVHVLGNILSGAVFGSAVERRLGPGGAALTVLASGILGNVGNALWHASSGDPGHASIGASTAVFGAVGILAATQILANRYAQHAANPEPAWRRLGAPLLGGLALLGSLGAGGARTDLGAHLFGFLAGVLVGFGAGWPMLRPGGAPRRWVQVAMGAVAVAILGGSWALALGR